MVGLKVARISGKKSYSCISGSNVNFIYFPGINISFIFNLDININLIYFKYKYLLIYFRTMAKSHPGTSSTSREWWKWKKMIRQTAWTTLKNKTVKIPTFNMITCGQQAKHQTLL